MHNFGISPSPLEDWSQTPLALGRNLLVKRDDLLPFPLAGNKVRKVQCELAQADAQTKTVITVGAIASNHCRTTAMLAARDGIHAHLILHGDPQKPSAELTFRTLARLGATWEVVEPSDIPHAIEVAQNSHRGPVHFIAGGCHTPSGVDAYLYAVHELANQIDQAPDWIVLASGTGATQAGIIAGCHSVGWASTRVLGVSVARDEPRGTEAIREALAWRGLDWLPIEFSTEYRASGYGTTDDRIETARDLGWRHGLPLDTTYTAKAFAALTDSEGPVPSSTSVVFWHTGGLNTQLMMDADSFAP